MWEEAGKLVVTEAYRDVQQYGIDFREYMGGGVQREWCGSIASSLRGV